MRLYLDKNYFFLFIDDGLYRIYNPILHLNFIVDLNVINLLNNLKKFSEIQNFKKKYLIIESTHFSLYENMYSNPDFIDHKQKKKYNKRNFDETIKFLIDKKIILKNRNTKYNLNKTNFFDRYKGNINEQIAFECTLRKKQINKWWLNQKFNKKGTLKETPYKYIQHSFLIDYFKKNLLNKKVLEIASGNGYWCNLMSKYSKKVYGLDYDKYYIDLSNQIHKNKNIKFINLDICDQNLIKNINTKFDYIFMIDFYLFLFDEKFQKKLFNKKNQIFRNIAKLLNKNGKILILDPHFFWLMPQFGSLDNSWGIFSEYNEKYFRTNPTLSESSKLFYESKLSINRIYEPVINKKYYNIDNKRFNFFKKFPQWIAYELVKNNEKN
tara:strand:+ start:227 stop:1369 length:1143 start_codon:yes stop_codon:yes gene_type:complete